MRNGGFLLACALLVACASARGAEDVQLLDVRRIWDQAPHNAFTSLLRIRGRWVCAFREAEGHVGPDIEGKMRVIVSDDAEKWESAALLVDGRGDIRDAKLAIMPDGRLMLLTATHLRGQPVHQSVAWFTKDLKTWEGPVDVGERNVWIWGIRWHKGVGYSIGYSTTADHFVRLYKTTDGKRFETVVDRLQVPAKFPNENAIVFDEHDVATVLQRCDPDHACIGRAAPPYTNWTWKQTNARVGGPALMQTPDGRLLGAARLHEPKVHTALFWVDGEGDDHRVPLAPLRRRYELPRPRALRRRALRQLLLEPRKEDVHLPGEMPAAIGTGEQPGAEPDPEAEGRYVLFYRVYKDKMRRIARVESDDFLHWAKPTLMEYERADGQPAPVEELYTNQTQPYFRAPHLYVATAARFMLNRQVISAQQAEAIHVDPKYFHDCSDGIFMTSRGGNVYQRTFMEAFVAPEPGPENWTSRTNYPALNVVQTGPSEMSLYVNENYAQPTAHLRRYTLRLDGFASVRADYDGGEMVTRPLKFTGSELLLNFATSAAGSIRVEVQDEAGRRSRALPWTIVRN
ncbi:MAG TPA: sialidase family protein [Tepidisphaeraceae bacterium]